MENQPQYSEGFRTYLMENSISIKRMCSIDPKSNSFKELECRLMIHNAFTR